MTRKEAIKVLEMFLYKQCDLARTKFAYDANTVWEAVNMASKALEQEPILDKIRAEIKNDWQLKKFPCSPFSCGLRQAIEIIDKYREEVHHKESEE